ncbi:nose resistant to fluoxetine protein 6 isoform X2 [Drosophila busckii]|uniref:nose resistant to fluoxetine protein 6 isoform X2 n=1 Tax=Drosophila busckii TaxID=30019 RepID=UPI00083F47D6|nr:nose resistant to fluoxetine protein 6 isoform X2 [Drosophila busckii]
MWREYVVLALGALLTVTQCFELNMAQYYEMPPLFHFDNYDRCLQKVNVDAATYCFVRSEVQPNRTSAVWQAIEKVSIYNKHHFDHRQLYFGLCMHNCQSELAKLDVNSLRKFQGGNLTDNVVVNVYLNLFDAEAANRARYNNLSNICLNWRLHQRGYDLQAKSVIEYCDKRDIPGKAMLLKDDAWNLTFYVVLCVLISLATVSSLVDLVLNIRCQDRSLNNYVHYKTTPRGFGVRILITCSLARNWYRLTQKPNGKIGRDLRFLDCLKFFAMFLVIFAHTNWVIYEGAISNPQDPERLLHTPAGTLLISGSLVTVTFFVISGLLLTINWLAVVRDDASSKNHTERWGVTKYVSVFVKFNIFRYIRLAVPYGIVILLSGVYFKNTGGPLWRHIYEREQLACRKNWWANMLFINNIVGTNERGWYLAADTQSFVLSLALLMCSHRFGRWSKFIYVVTSIIFMALPAVLTYTLDYYPIFLPTPQTQKNSFIEDRQFTKFYTSFYMNFGAYFYGVLAALIYNQITMKQYKLHNLYSFQVLWFALIPAGVIWLFTAHPIYQHYFTNIPIIWGAIYAGAQRNLWAFGLAIFVVGMAGKVGWVLRKFACLPIFRILGRLTYGAFLLHLLVARMVLATVREPIFVSAGTMSAFFFYVLCVSYLSSFLLAIFVELPLSSCLKLMR